MATPTPDQLVSLITEQRRLAMERGHQNGSKSLDEVATWAKSLSRRQRRKAAQHVNLAITALTPKKGILW